MKKTSERFHSPIAKSTVDPPSEQPSDELLREQIVAELAADGQLAGETIAVEVENGCAVLTGVISKEYLRQLVHARAGAVPGVLVVKDQLAVSQEGPMAGPQD